MTASVQTADWHHWERHPAGDEILILLSGRLEFVLETASGERRVAIEADQTIVIPTGLWHRAIVHKASELILITPGAGTEHRPVQQPFDRPLMGL